MQSLLQGGSVSAGGTPLGTPPGNGFHSIAGLPRTGSAQGMQHALQQQQQGPPSSNSFTFLGQVRGIVSCLQMCVGLCHAQRILEQLHAMCCAARLPACD